MDQLHSGFTLFLSLFVEAIPFLVLGILLSSALLFFVDEQALIRKLPRNPILGSFLGSCIGFLFPVCECGNVPVARRFVLQGVPLSFAVGFLLAAPTINPIVIWSTWVAFRDQPEIVVLRIVFSLGIATILGCIFGVQKDPRPLLQPGLARRVNLFKTYSTSNSSPKGEKSPSTSPLLQSGTFLLDQSGQPVRMDGTATLLKSVSSPSWIKKFEERFPLFLDNMVQELRELGGMLALGSAIAAAIQVFAPRELVLSLGQGPITSILAMMLLAALVSICSTVDSFFALSFASTFTSGSLLSFLVFGPMIDLKAIGLMLSIFKPKMIIYLFALAAQMTFILTLTYTYFF